MKAIFEKFIRSMAVILACLGSLVAINSCVEEEMPFIVLDQEEIEVGTDAEKYTIDVKANISWTATCAQEWVILYNPSGQYKGEFDFEVQANETTQERTAMICVSSPDGSIMSSIQIVQAPKQAGLYLTEEKVTFNKEKNSRKIRVVSNHKWNVLSSDAWCTVTPEESSASGDIEITVEENTGGDVRKATVSVICEVNVEKPIIRTVEVTQQGKDFYFSLPVKKFYIDNKYNSMNVNYDTNDPDVEIRLAADVDWIITDIPDCMAVESESVVRQAIEFDVVDNPSGTDRKGSVTATILSKGQEPIIETIEIFQSGTDFFFAFPTERYELEFWEDYVPVIYETSDPEAGISYSSNVSWIAPDNSRPLPPLISSADATEKNVHELYLRPNNTKETRTGKVTFTIKSEGQEPLLKTIEIVQKGLNWSFEIPANEFEVSRQRDTIIVTSHSTLPQMVMNYTITPSVSWMSVIDYDDLGQDQQTRPEPPIMIGNLHSAPVPSPHPGPSTIGDYTQKWAVIVDENKSDEVRTGKVTFTVTSEHLNWYEEEMIKPLVQTVTVKQSADELTLSIPVKEYHVPAYAADPLVLQWQATEAAVNYKSNAEWIELEGDPYGSPQVYAIISDNTSTKPRHGQVVFFTNKLGLEPIVQTVDIYQEGAERESVSFNIEELNVKPGGETVMIPFTATWEPQNVTLSNSDWCSDPEIDFADGAGTVKLTIDPNYSGSVRELFVTLTLSDVDAAAASSVKLIQKSEEMKFGLSAAALDLDFNNAEKYITIESMTAWNIQPETVPAWLQITPMQGTGNQSISFKAEKNDLPVERSTNIIFVTNDNTRSITLAVRQSENPEVIDANLYSYLGRGYKAAGIYADEEDIKAPVLDIKKLYAGNYLADIQKTGKAVETVIGGGNRTEYIADYTKTGSINENVSAFIGAVTNNFSSNALGIAEHKYGTVRQVYKKQVVKVYDGTTSENIKNCTSDGFENDIQKLTAQQLVLKYGTHVVTGLSLGGELEYSMSANTHNMTVDFRKALTEGYELAYRNNSTSTDQFLNISRNAADFEQKLVVRGGDIQLLNSNCTGNNEGSYSNWVTSLDNENTWVLAGFEGTGLMPLWDFIEDAGKKAEVKQLIEGMLVPDALPQQQSTLFKPKVTVGTYSTDLKNANGTSTWAWKIDLYNQETLIAKLANTENQDTPVFNWDDVRQAAFYGETTAVKSTSTSDYSDRQKNQKMTVKVTGLKCIDPSNDTFPDTDIDFTYDPVEGKWLCSADNKLYAYDETIPVKVESTPNWWKVELKISR